MGTEGEWPRCGEIDVMEYYRGWLLANVAWGTAQRWIPRWASTRRPITEFPDPDWPAKFHVWRMDRDPKTIQLSVDDQPLNTVHLDQTTPNDTPGATRNEHTGPFHQPHYLLLNLAIGGTNGGDPSKTRFPARFEVEYVRVYQRSTIRSPE